MTKVLFIDRKGMYKYFKEYSNDNQAYEDIRKLYYTHKHSKNGSNILPLYAECDNEYYVEDIFWYIGLVNGLIDDITRGIYLSYPYYNRRNK